MMGTGICPRCGTPIAANQSYCGNCGLRYSQQPLAEQVPPSPYGSDPNRHNTPTEEISVNPPGLAYGSQSDFTLPAVPYRLTPPSPVPPTLPPSPRRSHGPRIALIVGIVLLLLIIIGGGVFAFVRPQIFSTTSTPTTAPRASINATATAKARIQATANANATATTTAKGTATANVQATATAQVQATATADAHARATATVTSATYPFSMNLKLDDPLVDNSKGVKWKTSANCTFTGGAYHASETQNKTYYTCPAFNTNFSNITYQVTMQINKGDLGGITFRGNETTSKRYTFVFSQDGSYQFLLYTANSHARTLQQGSAASAGFKTRLSQQNDIAVVLRRSSIELYVNKQKLASVTDSTFSSGQIGVTTYDVGHATDVSFTNAKVWAL